MLEIKDLTLTSGLEKKLINNLSITISSSDKVAIIGEEGNGKSTLLKAIYDKDSIQNYCKVEGNVNTNSYKIGYLEQFLDRRWNEEPTINFFIKENPESEADYSKYEELGKLHKIFNNLKIPYRILESDQKIKTLSGGEKVKLQLAKILFNDAVILLLDEPTNDLDIETLEWLEDFIINYPNPIMFISHDETLIEKTANIILHMEQVKSKNDARHTIEKTNYKDYVEKRERAISKQSQMAVSEEKRI
ncbi:MAG: ATP-binding cassette domain-containing protein [Bacilli bacterium]|nr:ATP-binding cassette domain-containing protein [Bacilli bacterium]